MNYEIFYDNINTNDKIVTDYGSNLKHYLCGSIAGIVGITLSHPIDTIKTHVQENKKIPKFENIIQCIKYLYGGIKYPLIGTCLEKSVVFGTYKNSMTYFDFVETNILHNFLSGLIAGFCASAIVTPFEKMKIMKQMHKEINPFCLNNNGLMSPTSIFKNMYTGFTPTLFRETPGFGIYFASYQYLTSKLNQERKMVGNFILGGFAGMFSWLFIYPQDRVKTKMQANGNITIKCAISEIYKNGGITAFYRGFSFALVRSIPLHAGAFATYEYMSTLIV